MEQLPRGTKIELGAGVGFLREVAPSVVSTDSIPFPTNDLTFLPTSLPFNTDSVSGIFMIDTFSRIPGTRAFLTEAQRVLKPGGKIIMIEPASSVWGRLASKWFSEKNFDRSADWTCACSLSTGKVNSAMAWIVFERDLEQFHQEFPGLSLASKTYHTPFRYFVGGNSRFERGLAPQSSYSLFKNVDGWLSSLSPQWSMFMTIVIEKK
ncbi:class I SAM-dependent methyltransferase [Persicitalea jodogahamensis]|nr:methyltransferase domain-containing protein [Persicitalea jodogahamensis]